MPIAIIVHGGAWAIPDDEVDLHRNGCRVARDAAWQVLSAGGTALDAVEAAVRTMEDDPIFDAGVGSVLNSAGFVELDAAVMSGETLRSGAVAAVRNIRHPITLARHVLDSHVVLLVGEGAERFANTVGMPSCDPAELIVEREYRRWQDLTARGNYQTQEAFSAEPPSLTSPHDTVGAVALDQYGNLAAATSTGGVSHKPPGRVGDSPLIGAGLYADNQTGGASSTGWGESIIKVLLAKTATDMISSERSPQQAAEQAIDLLSRRVGGLGGLILLDQSGRVGLAFNTPRMAYAWRTAHNEADGV